MMVKEAVKRELTEQAKRSLEFARAASAVAGHEVTDPVLLEILENAAMCEMTGDEAVAAIRRHVQG